LDTEAEARSGTVVVAHMKRRHASGTDRGRTADLEFVEARTEGALYAGGTGKRRFHLALEPARQARRSGDQQGRSAPGGELPVQHERRDAAEMIGVEMGDQDRVDRIGIDAEPLYADHRACAAVDQ